MNKVLEGFEKTPLYHVNPEGDQLWLADARLLFVKWPRADIQPLEDAPMPTATSSTNIAKIVSQHDYSKRLPQTSRFYSQQRSNECSQSLTQAQPDDAAMEADPTLHVDQPVLKPASPAHVQQLQSVAPDQVAHKTAAPAHN